ncbi:MAG: hypothetical protein HKN26_08840 [Acidimicrobiales bacterium]|nr:hypothetical protein [Acidimicrobiales bacterium]
MDGTGAPCVELGPSASWILGTAVTVGSLVFVAVGLFELFVYDIPTLGPAWGPSVLIGAVALWFAMATAAAKRLRVDADGVHQLSILRYRSRPWSDIDSVLVRPARVPIVDGIVTFTTARAPLRTPWGLNAGDGGAQGLLQRVAPVVTAYHGVDE